MFSWKKNAAAVLLWIPLGFTGMSDGPVWGQSPYPPRASGSAQARLSPSGADSDGLELVELALPPDSMSLVEKQGSGSNVYFGWEEISLRGPGTELDPKSSLPPPAEPENLIRPWWVDEAEQPIGYGTATELSALDQLIAIALGSSPFIQAIQLEPQILETKIDQAYGPFDASSFVDSIFRDTSDPVGNTLITGSANRLNEIGTDNRAGIRKKNFRGGTGELTQELDFLNNNSDFFVPKQQASTKLRLGYTQPLMKGSGVSYNLSTMVIAELASNASGQQAIEKIQQHVYKLTIAYWELVSARAHFRQNRRAIALMVDLREQLAGREDIDSLQSQLWRADAAIARLQAAQANALSQITTNEAQLRAAIGSQDLTDPTPIEMLPSTLPNDWKKTISVSQELANVLVYHPRIQELKLNLRATRVKLNVAEQDLRPTLDLVVDGYLRGLNGDYQAAQSWMDQFSRGAPSYSGGLVYQRPVRNTAAKAILRERRLELRKDLLELDQSLLNIESSVIEAVAQIDAAFQELKSAIHSTLAVHSELQYLNDRWKDAFRDETQRSLLLDQLLNAQLQLVQSENAWAKAQSDHMIALAKLKWVTATLLSISAP